MREPVSADARQTLPQGPEPIATDQASIMQILRAAVQEGASDLHFKAGEPVLLETGEAGGGRGKLTSWAPGDRLEYSVSQHWLTEYSDRLPATRDVSYSNNPPRGARCSRYGNEQPCGGNCGQ